MRIARIVSLTLLVAPLAAAAEPAQPQPTPEGPIEFRGDVVAMPAAFPETYWAVTRDLVNGPKGLVAAFPGQALAFGLYVSGEKREQLVRTVVAEVRVRHGAAVTVVGRGKPHSIKRIKPHGGDFALMTAKAVGIGRKDLAEVERSMSRVSMLVLPGSWTVPSLARGSTVEIEVTLEHAGVKTTRAGKLEVPTFDEEARREFADLDEIQEWMARYYEAPEPGRLLPALRQLFAKPELESALFAPNSTVFFALALQGAPEAARDFASRIRTESRALRVYGALVLQWAGYDVQALTATLGERDRKTLAEQRTMPALDIPEDPTDLQQTSLLMDANWAAFMVTGRIERVRAIAGLLRGRDDYEALAALRARGVPPEATRSVVRGVLYATAGWSLGSFLRTSPLVADYVDAFAADPSISPVVQQELGGLLTNDAFAGSP